MNALKSHVVLIEPCGGGFVTVEVRVYEDDWIESFYDGHLCNDYHFTSPRAAWLPGHPKYKTPMFREGPRIPLTTSV